MREHLNALSRRSFIGGAATLGIIAAFSPSSAFAKTAAETQADADAVRNQLVGLQADLESSAENYKKALDEHDAAQDAMNAAQAQIDDANAQIADHQDKLGVRARSMYRTGSTSFLDFLLGSSSFDELAQNWDILTSMNENDSQMVQETKTLREQLQEAKDEYSRQEQIAADKTEEAKQLKDAAEAKVNQATDLYNSLDSEAQALLADEQAAAARAAAEQAAASQPAPQVDNGNGGGGSNGGGSNGGGGGNGGGGSNGGGGGGSNGGGGGGGGSYGSVVDYALSRIGCPYVWGAEGPDSFDCSGLVRWAYLQVGVSLPHQTESLYACASNIVSVSEARPGDVLYRYGHVGIAVGYGGVPYVHAPTFNDYVRDDYPLSWAGFTCALQF